MDFLEYRDPERAKKFTKLIQERTPDEEIKIMHVCGTHESSICEYGIRSILPDNISLVEGPGCPVCVTPVKHVDEALHLAENEDVILTTFGDMVKVSGSKDRLSREKENVKIVYSVSDAVELAEETEKEVVFFGVGFETTAATYAPVLLNEPENFSLLGSVKRIPPAMEFLLDHEETDIDGFMAPGHVSTIIGASPYRDIAEDFDAPIVVSGFEPLDILSSVAELLKIMNSEPRVENLYERAVNEEGNPRAQQMMDQAFEVKDAEWRGIGEIPDSGLEVKNNQLDAREKYNIELTVEEYEEPEDCICDQIILGKSEPGECPLFNSGECSPQNPVGPCMVGSEGMCNVWYEYGGRMDV